MMACLYGSNEGPCSREFKDETVLSNLNNCLELTSGELDLVILANIQAFTRNESTGSKRSRGTWCNFQFRSVTICKDTCLHLFGLSYSLNNTLPQRVQRTFIIFLPIMWKRMRLPYLEGYRDSSDMTLKYCPRMKRRPVSGACTPLPVKLLVNKRYVTANSLTCGNSSIQMLLFQNQWLTFALPVNKTRLSFCVQQTYPSKKNQTV